MLNNLRKRPRRREPIRLVDPDPMDIDKTTLFSLPNEVILEIISHLPGPSVLDLAMTRNRRITNLCLCSPIMARRSALIRNAHHIKSAVANATRREWIEDAAYIWLDWNERRYRKYPHQQQITRLTRQWRDLTLPDPVTPSLTLNTGVLDSPNPLHWLHLLNRVLLTEFNNKFAQKPDRQKAQVLEADLDNIEHQVAALSITLPTAFVQLMRSRKPIDTLPNPIPGEPFMLELAPSLRRIRQPIIYVDRDKTRAQPSGGVRVVRSRVPEPQTCLLDGYVVRFARVKRHFLQHTKWYSLFVDVNGRGQCVLASRFDPCAAPPANGRVRPPAIPTVLSEVDRELGIEGYANCAEKMHLHGFLLAGLSFEEWIVRTVYCACAKTLCEQGFKLPRCLEVYLVGTHSRLGTGLLRAGLGLETWGLVADGDVVGTDSDSD